MLYELNINILNQPRFRREQQHSKNHNKVNSDLKFFGFLSNTNEGVKGCPLYCLLQDVCQKQGFLLAMSGRLLNPTNDQFCQRNQSGLII